MSKLGILGAVALSLVLTVATPTFAAEFSGGAMPFGGGSRGAQGSSGSVIRYDAVAHCHQRWAYYDEASNKYMGDDGEWHLCQ
jgi:hypothetical protein